MATLREQVKAMVGENEQLVPQEVSLLAADLSLESRTHIEYAFERV